MSPNPHEEAESHTRHGGGADEVMPSYDFQPIRAAAPAASAASLRGSLDSMAASSNLKSAGIMEPHVLKKVSHEEERGNFNAVTIADIDRTMKKYADNLLHALEGVSSRLSQLEGRTHHLENSVGKLSQQLVTTMAAPMENWDNLRTHMGGGVHSSLDWPEDEWDKLIKTNLTGLWLVAKHVCRRMHDAKLKGSLINISSVAGVNRGHLPGSIGYTSSKSAVHYATKLMALELGAFGIRVNSIAPGIFKSEITAPLLQKRWLNTVISKIVPLKTNGTTDPALTSPVRFLIHETSSYVTGNIFIVDSGVTLPGVPVFSSL